jgi:hypothetical protein
VRKARLAWNIYLPEDLSPRTMRASKDLWNLALRHCYRTRTTEGFASLKHFLRTAAESAPRLRSVELMVHPGHQNYEEETALLSGEWWKALPFEIQTISYQEL